jgi:hypothetical protein
MKRVFSMLGLALALSGCGPAQVTVTGKDLHEIVQNVQRAMVRESWGEDSASCFTDLDLQEMRRSGLLNRLADRLRTDKVFLEALEKLRALPADERARALRESRVPMRQRWDQIGEISRRGTTIAGQQAEVMIANRIVDLAEELLSGRPRAAVGARGGVVGLGRLRAPRSSRGGALWL